MATYEERYKLIRDAQINPIGYADDAALQVDFPNTTLVEVNGANLLLHRVQAALVDVANTQLALAPETGDNTTRIRWAQAVTQSPAAEALRVLRILLARFDTLTPAQILDPAVGTDAVLETELTALVPPFRSATRAADAYSSTRWHSG